MIDRGVSYENIIIIGLFSLGFMLVFNAVKLARYLYKKRKGILGVPKAESMQGFSKVIYLIARSSFYLIDLLLVIFLLYIAYDLTGDPHVSKQYPQSNEVIVNPLEPIRFEFNRPLNSESIKPYIHPEVEGKWELEAGDQRFPYIKRVLVFYPKWSLPINEKIFIYIAGIANPYNNREPWEFGVDSTSPKPITTVIADPKDQAKDIKTDNVSINFTFDQPSGLYYDWNLLLDPEVPFTTEIRSQNLLITFSEKLQQSTTYSYTLSGLPARKDLSTGQVAEVTSESQEMLKGSFTTVKEPLLDSIEPQGSKVLPAAPVRITFDLEMEQAPEPDEYLAIEPSVAGEATWSDAKTLNFEHEPFNKDTNYKVTIKKGLVSSLGGVLEKDLISEFKTIGKVQLDSSSPANNGGGVGVGSNIVITFDQEVVKDSAQSKFSISPNMGGSFSWDGNTMTFNPSANFSYSTKYTVKIAAGVESVQGLNSETEFSFSFTTQEEQFKLNVPIYCQKLRFSCNLEATRMALAYRGIYKDVMSLYGQIAKDTTPYDEVNNTFGDPYSGYTGDIYGVSKGYGVYWPPISNLISNYRSNAIKTGWNLEGLLNEVRAGNPVVIWAHNGYSYAGNEYYWTTPSGKSIRAVTGMHSYVVVGFRGPINDPTHVILNDSNRGVWTISKSYFLSLWGYFNNSGVVVY